MTAWYSRQRADLEAVIVAIGCPLREMVCGPCFFALSSRLRKFALASVTVQERPLLDFLLFRFTWDSPC